jgi:hypothetical protein
VIAARPIALVVLTGSLLWKRVLVLAGSALTALAPQVRVPFIPGDLFKMVLAARVLPSACRLIRR